MKRIPRNLTRSLWNMQDRMETEKQRTIWLEEATFFSSFSPQSLLISCFRCQTLRDLVLLRTQRKWLLRLTGLPIWKKACLNVVTFQLEEHCHPGGNSRESLSLQVDPSFRELALRNGVKSLVSLCKESMPNWMLRWSVLNGANTAWRLKKTKHRAGSIIWE